MDLTNLNKDRKARRKSSLDLGTMVYGKVPPQAKDLEEAILGALMLEADALDRIGDILQPECFYADAHQRIYRAILSLNSRNVPCDILTVVEQLKSSEELDIVGGPYLVTKLTNHVVSSANIVAHAQIVYQKFVQREVIRIASEMITEAYEDSSDAFDLLDDSEHKLSRLSISGKAAPYKSLQSVAIAALQEVYQIKRSGSELTGVPSGIRRLDLITQGWQPSNFIVIGARPSVGKSAVAANLAYNAATSDEKRTPVAVFTLEMPAIQWVFRIMSAAAEIDLFNLKRGKVNDQDIEKLNKAAIEFTNAKVFFDDTSNLDIHQLKSKCRLLVSKEKVGLIIIDYLQLMSGSRAHNENREQEISKISRDLKQLAKELNIPIIALSQLSRQGDTPVPKLSHIRESGAIEQDADDVLFLTEVSEEEIHDDPSLKDSILIRIAKHRNGVREKVAVKFVRKIQKIMSESEYEDYIARKDPQLPLGRWKPVDHKKLADEKTRSESIPSENIDQTTAPKETQLDDAVDDLPF